MLMPKRIYNFMKEVANYADSAYNLHVEFTILNSGLQMNVYRKYRSLFDDRPVPKLFSYLFTELELSTNTLSNYRSCQALFNRALYSNIKRFR